MERRSEPRFKHGARIRVRLWRNAQWAELPAFTVNVSENGLLVTVQATPALGEGIRVELPGQPGSFVEATVRHAIRGTANSLVGLRLHEPQDVSYARGEPLPEGE